MFYMNMTFSKNLRKLRKEIDISQEQLAENFGITVQAVSKWECGLSYPDIELLPQIADFFHVTIDALLRASETVRQQADETFCIDLPDDGVLRIVQCKGKRLLQRDEYAADYKIPLCIDSALSAEPSGNIHVEIWGSAQIEGEIKGNVTAEDGVVCANVGGNVAAGDGVICANVEGSVEAGDGVVCASVRGNVKAGDGVVCQDIYGNVTCEDDIHCRNIMGEVNCSGDIYYDNK